MLGALCVTLLPWHPSGFAPMLKTICDAAKDGRRSEKPWTLESRDYEETYVNQPFVGNGYLGLRVPAAGQGYWVGQKAPDDGSPWPLGTPRFTSAMLAGYYGDHAYLSALPNWSALTIGDGESRCEPMTLAKREVSEYRQSLDMMQGVVTTSFVWTSPSGNRARLTWRTLAHRKLTHLGVVRLDVVPLRWSGDLRVDSFLDMRGMRRATELRGKRLVEPGAGRTETSVVSDGTRTRASLVSETLAPSGFPCETLDKDDECGLRWRIVPKPGATYTFVKRVGIASENDSDAPTSPTERGGDKVRGRAASVIGRLSGRGAAPGHATRLYGELLASHVAAWRDVWRSEVVVDERHPGLQATIRASEYMLYSNVRQGARNSVPPAGLTSDNYAGMVFWDAETWIYPFLLATHPEMARSVVDFRYDNLQNALGNVQRDPAGIRATEGGYFPWTSGRGRYDVDGGGTSQIHLQADIALAQMQYFEATGDLRWLRAKGWPVLRAIADYYCSRVTENPDGSLSIVGVDGPDEYTRNAADAAYTNGSALRAVGFAAQAAALLGFPVPQAWTGFERKLVKPTIDSASRIHLQYRGFDPARPRTLKQADVVLLAYPMEYPMDPDTAVRDLRFYSAITDPLGPSMTNSVHAIVAARHHEPSFGRFLIDSYRPFVKGPFLNFNETSVLTPSAGQLNPAFTFLTGTGGFLQALVNGAGGCRFRSDAFELRPTLPSTPIEGEPLRRVVLKGLRWHGRTIDVDVSPERTLVRLRQGNEIRVRAPQGKSTLKPGSVLRLQTQIL